MSNSPKRWRFRRKEIGLPIRPRWTCDSLRRYGASGLAGAVGQEEINLYVGVPFGCRSQSGMGRGEIMSALLMLFYWVAIPYLLFELAKFFYKKSSSLRSKVFICLAYFSYISFFLWVAVGRNMWLDAKVKELCAKNGGIHVYETVKLTPDLLDKKGKIRIPLKSSMKPYHRYYYDTVRKVIWKDMMDFTKIVESHYLVIRASDNKILGENIFYSRLGGGLPVYWHIRPFLCPLSDKNVEDHIFLK